MRNSSLSSIEIIQEINNLIHSQDYNFFIDVKNQNNKLGDEYLPFKNMYFEVFRNCIEYHQDLEKVNSYFESLILILNEIYIKEKFLVNFINLKTSKESENSEILEILQLLIKENIHLICQLFRIFIKIALEAFKENYRLENSCIIKENLREILKNIDLFSLFSRLLKENIKYEILQKIREFEAVYDKLILADISNLFNNFLYEWAQANLRLEASTLKEEFSTLIKKEFLENKTNKFFDIITNYPESHVVLVDIKSAMLQSEHENFIKKVKNQISQRLLTPGIATPLIIEIFIRVIKILKFIDPSSYILEVISDPIKKYLRQRKDTMRWIINTILSEEDTIIKEDLGKQYIKSTYSLISSNRENDYDYISSDEDELAAENWQPLPMGTPASFTKNKFSDIISILVNIFGSPEKFVEQYKRMLAERCVSDSNFSIENEIKNLELLKIKFGEQLLQGCDIIIKDVNDSTKINSTIKNLISTGDRGDRGDSHSNPSSINEFELNCLIINKNFWPFQNNPIFSLQSEDEGISFSNSNPNQNNSLTSTSKCNFLTKNYDKFLNSINLKLENYKKKFSSIKFSRTLNFFTNIGFVDLTLSFDNGTFCFRVSQLAALVINLFDESEGNEAFFENFTLDFISDKLNSSLADVKKKINFWISKGVLTECNSNWNKKTNEIEEKIYFTPNKILKNLELVFSNNLIIEEEIFLFEYVETESKLNLENAINSIIKNSGPRNFEQLYKNLVISYQVTFSEIKLKEVLGKMILEQKLFKEGELYKLIVPNY